MDDINNSNQHYYQPQPYRKKPALAKTIISIILLVVGVILCFVNAMLIIIVLVMPNSIGAYYISDMIENGFLLFNPIFLLIIGAVLVIIGIILLLRKNGKIGT